MKYGERYYTIVKRGTDENLEDAEWNVLRFETEKDAEDYIVDNLDYSDNFIQEYYEVICNRW